MRVSPDIGGASQSPDPREYPDLPDYAQELAASDKQQVMLAPSAAAES